MADRYWVGGTGTWDGSNTTNWSASSGGATGASVPTTADNVFFDANSNTGTNPFTVSLWDGATFCKDFTASGLDGLMTLGGSTSTTPFRVSGSLTVPASNFVCTYLGVTTFDATTTGNTITTNGVAFKDVTFNGVGGGWTLGSALNCNGYTITITRGTFDTSGSNYAVTAYELFSNSTTAKTINLNASTVTLNGGDFSILVLTNLTFNAGTSTIILSSAFGADITAGLTFYNVSFTGTSSPTSNIYNANTFNNLSIAGKTTVGTGLLTVYANQTINGTFTVSAGTASAYRIRVASDTIGTTRTLTCGTVSLTDVDFRDITIAGAASPASGTRLGDCKGNSGITFPAAKTVYYGQTGSASWGTTGSGSWAATSGGALDATMFPLAQDTAVFPAATYPAPGSTTTINDPYYNIGTIDMSLRTTNTMTLSTLYDFSFYGNWINGTGTTLSGTVTITFAGRTTQQITSSSKTFTQPILINSPSGSVTLQDALTQSSTVATTLTNGTLDLNGFTYTVGTRLTTAAGTKDLTFNGGTLVCPVASTTAFNNAVPTGFTTTAGTGTGTISMTAATAKTFVGGGSTFNCALNQGGLGALTVTGSNTFSDITNTVQPASVLFTAGTTSTFTNFSLSGTVGNLITIGSVTAASHTLSKASGTVLVSNCSISRSSATGGAIWGAFTYSGNVDGGNNSGWNFGSTYTAAITDTTTVTDSLPIASETFNILISETATATDVITYTFLPFWNFVDNSQTITWTPTPTDTSTTWNLIDNNQTITWTPIPTDTSTTWVLVDDTAPTTWQNINN